jgi:hypothetical protein
MNHCDLRYKLLVTTVAILLLGVGLFIYWLPLVALPLTQNKIRSNEINHDKESRSMRVYDGHLHVHYGQAYVRSNGDFTDMQAGFVGQSNGLCGAAELGNLFLITGLHTGNIGMVVDVLDSEPAIGEEWEEVVEVSFNSDGKPTALFDWNGVKVCDIALNDATYRVRYSGKGMDRGHHVDTLVDEAPVDSYALQFWQSEAKPDKIIKQTSRTASYWHKWVASIPNDPRS